MSLDVLLGKAQTQSWHKFSSQESGEPDLKVTKMNVIKDDNVCDSWRILNNSNLESKLESILTRDKVVRHNSLAKSVRDTKNQPWYWGIMSSKDAKALLIPHAIGTFIIRDSSEPMHLFSLSVKTERGVTSVRIKLKGDSFQLDSDAAPGRHVPTFRSVLELVSYYVCKSLTPRKRCYWLESSGRMDTQVILTQALSMTEPVQIYCHHRLLNCEPDSNCPHCRPARDCDVSIRPQPNSVLPSNRVPSLYDLSIRAITRRFAERSTSLSNLPLPDFAKSRIFDRQPHS